MTHSLNVNIQNWSFTYISIALECVDISYSHDLRTPYDLSIVSSMTRKFIERNRTGSPAAYMNQFYYRAVNRPTYL